MNVVQCADLPFDCYPCMCSGLTCTDCNANSACVRICFVLKYPAGSRGSSLKCTQPFHHKRKLPSLKMHKNHSHHNITCRGRHKPRAQPHTGPPLRPPLSVTHKPSSLIPLPFLFPSSSLPHPSSLPGHILNVNTSTNRAVHFSVFSNMKHSKGENCQRCRQ